MKRLLLLLLLLAAVVPVGRATAVELNEILSDPALEARARSLSRELRCMVCQNQSIDDSDAPLARDLRILVRERLKAGDSDGQVLDFLVARYGEFVLLRPRFSAQTALLWLSPAVVLLIGILGLALVARRRRAGTAPAGSESGLSSSEEARLDEILRRPDAPAS